MFANKCVYAEKQDYFFIVFAQFLQSNFSLLLTFSCLQIYFLTLIFFLSFFEFKVNLTPGGKLTLAKPFIEN